MTGIVLAGGRSRRMGRDKTALELAGQTLPDRAAAVLRECFAEVLIIRHDDRPGLGPIGGLQTALRRVQTDALFVVAGDMPWLEAGLIRQMAGELPGFDAVAFPDEPLHAAYATTIRPVVDQQIAAGEYALRRLLTKLRVRPFTTPQRPAALTNVNTPADWAAVRQRSDT